MPKQGSALDRYFEISKRGSSVSTEIRGGLATFFAMSYIVVLNPLILGGEDSMGNTMPGPAIAAATALVAGVLTIIMGVWAKHPFAIATGLGVNAFVAVTAASSDGLTWPDVMGLVVVAGLAMVILVLTGFRTAVFRAVPASLKMAIVVGIGLFVTVVGLVNAGFVRRVPDAAGSTVPLQLGINGDLLGWPTVVFLFGLLLTIVLMSRKVRGAILIGIVGATALSAAVEAFFQPGSQGAGVATGWSLVAPSLPEWTWPDLSLVGQADIFGAFQTLGGVAASLLAFVILLSIFFDAMGTMVGLATEAGSIDKDGNIPNVERVLLVDAAGAVAGGGSGVSSNQIFVESGTGIGEGARTGLASVVTGLLFIAAMFLTPLIYLVPFEAVAPALVVVGYLMFTQVSKIEWGDIGLAIPAFLTITVMPFTYSIANGLGAGFVAYVVIRTAQGRAREIHPLMWVVAAAFVLFFSVGAITEALG